MKREYEDYFASRYRGIRRYEYDIPRGFRFYPPSLIETLLAKIPNHWRSDARFFLADNLLKMVILPYDYVDGPDVELLPDGKVWRFIDEDLRKIINEAESVAKSRAKDYVSATSVVIALGRVVENLQTTSLQIWGPTATK